MLVIKFKIWSQKPKKSCKKGVWMLYALCERWLDWRYARKIDVKYTTMPSKWVLILFNNI